MLTTVEPPSAYVRISGWIATLASALRPPTAPTVTSWFSADALDVTTDQTFTSPLEVMLPLPAT